MRILKRYVSVIIRGMYSGSGAGAVIAISNSFISGVISAVSIDIGMTAEC